MIIIFYDNIASFKKSKLTYKLILGKQKQDSKSNPVFWCLQKFIRSGWLKSLSHPVELNSGSQDWRPLPVVSARLVPSPLRYSGPVIQSWAFALVSCEVEFGKAEAQAFRG